MPSYNRETFAIIKVLFGIILNYLLWGGGGKDFLFHIFALKYAYTLRTISKVKRQPSEWEKIIANEATDKQLI